MNNNEDALMEINEEALDGEVEENVSSLKEKIKSVAKAILKSEKIVKIAGIFRKVLGPIGGALIGAGIVRLAMRHDLASGLGALIPGAILIFAGAIAMAKEFKEDDKLTKLKVEKFGLETKLSLAEDEDLDIKQYCDVQDGSNCNAQEDPMIGSSR